MSPSAAAAQTAASEVGRDEAERGLTFVGFLVLHCPPRPESREVLTSLTDSGHTLQVRGRGHQHPAPSAAFHHLRRACLTAPAFPFVACPALDDTWHALPLMTRGMPSPW